MRVLRKPARGDDVEAWQDFLLTQGCDPNGSDGVFGGDTEAATRAFQGMCGLPATGEVGPETLAAALQRGFLATAPANQDPNWPPKPAFPPLVSNDQRAALFGRFAFVAAPLPDNPENIRITDDWAQRNIVSVLVPQMMGVANRSSITFHKAGAKQLQALWSDWEAEGMLKRVLSWGGSYVPRFIRGSTTVLSNHAFGTAFDINMKWNSLNAQPALVGEPGCVRELVAAAHRHGFYWGGHFGRMDGMHFELARLA